MVPAAYLRLMSLPFITIAASLASACSDRLAWSLPQEPLSLELRTGSCVIDVNSNQYTALADWLARNRDGWSSSVASYVQGEQVRGRDFTINVLDSFVVVNYPGGQVTHKAAAGDFDFLTCRSVG